MHEVLGGLGDAGSVLAAACLPRFGLANEQSCCFLFAKSAEWFRATKVRSRHNKDEVAPRTRSDLSTSHLLWQIDIETCLSVAKRRHQLSVKNAFIRSAMASKRDIALWDVNVTQSIIHASPNST